MNAGNPQKLSPLRGDVTRMSSLTDFPNGRRPKSVHRSATLIPFTFGVALGFLGIQSPNRPQRYSPLPDPKPVHQCHSPRTDVLVTALRCSGEGLDRPQKASPLSSGRRSPSSFTNSPYPHPERPTTVHRIPKSTCLAPHKCSPSSQVSSPYCPQSLAAPRFGDPKGLPKGL